MFLLSDGALVYSASDLANAASCEFALLRSLDAKLGRIAPLELAADAMLARAAALGDAHEQRVLQGFRDRFGPWDRSTGTGVVEIERPEFDLGKDRAALEAKRDETLSALRTGAGVVYQAGFFDGRFGGWADFLIREPGRETAASGPVYAVYDTKLARHAKVTALLQLAAYADQLITSGLTPAPEVHLILGDRATTSHRLADLLPVYRDRRARLQGLLDAHRSADQPVVWADPYQPHVRACGRCEVCAPEIARTRDLLLVAGMRGTQRTRLRDAGVTTIDDLAASTVPVPKIGAGTLDKLRAQAALQVRQGELAPGAVAREMFAPDVVRALPAADPGDLFFDFEGDPLWAEGSSTDWGLEYLFGVVEQPATPEAAPVFTTFWAHDRAEEKKALLDFLDYLAARRAVHPDLHVYHYAAYEKSALQRLAGRHGVGEDAVADLLRAGVLVDLYTIVRASVRVGQDSYSIKKLEPLYMPSARSGEVTNASASIVEYAEACAVRDAGNLDGPDGFAERLGRIAEYNEYDCVSTLRLRDWLVATAAELPATPTDEGPAGTLDPADGAVVGLVPPERDETAEALLALVGEGPATARTNDQQAVAMLAASLGYHWREETPFWWGHFDRLRADPADWTEPRGTVVADHVQVLQDWAVPPGKRNARRRLRLVGRLEPGSELRAGAKVIALYDAPIPECAKVAVDATRGWLTGAEVVEVTVGTAESPELSVLIVDESLPGKAARYAGLPMGLGPCAPPSSATVRAAIRALADGVVGTLAASPGELTLPEQPALDLLRRIPPRTRSRGALPAVQDGPDAYIDAITAALLDLDHSYLAVQGPPGTGKTYAGSRVIARLVARGWRVGVVAQSHAVVENMLAAVRAAGVAAEQVGKKPAQASPTRAQASPVAGAGGTAAPWKVLKDNGAFEAFYAAQTGGYVVGGTSWDFTNANRLPPGGFDVLVIDEAGQFALANTVAVSAGARNLLLLGDPQQLPQVSQGKHPEPVDRSALGWLADDHETLPPTLGYFLAQTWRMHPALCAAVSRLSYEGRLTAMPVTAHRSLDGVEPGVRTVLVEHAGNAVASIEEADEVVRQVHDVVGRRWRDPARLVAGVGEDRPLEPADVVVVAAYNAQRWTIRRALDAAGLGAVKVGTVDKFQGQQAPVVIVSTAASTADDVPRGMEFLLSRNRINVAVSRGMWCAIVVRSAALTDYLPTRPDGLEELGAFIGLCED
ncbi:TM0106 family RecB-like putative nuclease [Pengzhenrongella frigida]|uniref:TM0106 family RecB-like putative nuclease n=1 Tax=Pengzhenrongella frigida TaxID=1259133 RepID=A0A4Q5MYS6_9MICO|nr:bifunctional RecB family nuclease/DEAD/DEAH box helicase [Cellulomonas sp. HLT2-17]RYV49397.1 TM0106 family RecB-like putative nuclease [Cellulomonas sp. HLT2-17]